MKIFSYFSLAALCTLGAASLGSCGASVPPSDPGQGVIALFNPGVSPPIVPSPTDLVRVGGKLMIPEDPAESSNGALKAFNDYLRSLDGFPPDSGASTSFSGLIDATSLQEGVIVYDATTHTELDATAAKVVLEGESKSTLVVNKTTRWENGHTYFVGVWSFTENNAAHGVRSTDGKVVLADTAFSYLRSENPLYARCQNPVADCVCPDLSDTTCHSVVDGITNAQAAQLEVGRQGLKPIIDEVVALKARKRNDLVMAWSFTISARSFATFDAGRANIPFPSNLLLSDMGLGDPNAHVNVPILPTDDPKTAALKTGLNTLDGFSTTGSVQFPIDVAKKDGLPVDIDAATVLPGQTALLLNITSLAAQPSYSAKPLHAILDTTSGATGFAGQIWVTPRRPLQAERTNYASVLTTNIKDINGQALVPAPATLLMTQSSPLLTQDGESAVPQISKEQAVELEALRQGFQPLVTQLQKFGIPASSIAAITVYRTQSIITPITTLIGALTAQGAAIPTTISITGQQANPAPFTNIAMILHGTMTVRRVVDLRGPFNTARLAPTTTNDTIPFMMTLPKSAPAGGAPVIIAQHGLTRWRGDTIAIADTIAAQKMAMIAIDVIYHGGRVICLADTDCAAGVTCNQPVAGQPGQCTGGAYLTATGATALPGTTDLLPNSTMPSRDFTNLANPFAERDNFRQHTLDLFQLVRVIKATATGSLKDYITTNSLTAIDQTKIGYVGQSLGAILGTNFLAMSPNVNLGVLNVGGGDLVDMFSDPQSTLSVGVAAALGVTPGTPQFFGLLENFRWIIDPADPLNYARFVRSPSAAMTTRTAAKVILQESGMDTVIRNPYTLALGIELGLPVDANSNLQGIDQEGTPGQNLKTTFFANADHGALFNFTVPALTLQIQSQAVTYLQTGLSGPPTVQ